MRVAFILPSLKNSAPINVALAIADKLSNSDILVDVFYLRNEIELDFHKKIKYEHISFTSNFNWSNYDIVHSHMFRPDLFVFLRKPFFTQTKTVSTIHNYVYPELNNYYNKLISYLFGTIWLLLWLRFNLLITLTKHSLNYYQKISLNKKIDFIYNGRDIIINYESIDNKDVKLINELKSKYAYVIGVYCALIKRKRIDILINHLSRSKSGCLIILGEGKELNNLQNLVFNLNLQERVVFLGKKYNAHQYNSLFDIYSLPSEDEGFGLALIEAALHKKNIICSNIDVFQELFDEKCVTFFDLNNEGSIDIAIKNALFDKLKAINAYEKAIEFYSEKVMSKNYHILYKKLIFNNASS
jgi:glycosyltransferase involved in cell wall biosynthesis